VALEISNRNKSYTIQEALVKPYVQTMAEIVLGKVAETKLAVVSLSKKHH